MSQNIIPVPNPTASYWLSEPHWLDNHRSTPELPSHADFVIIGTGIAGVSTAYHLTETDKLANRNRNLNDTAPPSHQGQRGAETPPPSILLLEGRTVCSGATGRNGGHIKKLPSTIDELIQVYGFGVAGEIVQFIRENIYAVKDVIEKEGIAAEAELRRSLDVCLDEDDANAVREKYEKLRGDGFPLMEDVGFITGDGDRGVVERVSALDFGLSRSSRVLIANGLGTDNLTPRRKDSPQHTRPLTMALQICDPAARTSLAYRTRKSTNKHTSDSCRDTGYRANR